jgi:hypothetical protein
MRLGELVLALTGTGLQILLLLVLFIRRLHIQYRWFSAYLGISLLETAALFAVRSHSSFYFSLYWITEAATTVMVFFALQEAFRAVFRNFYSLTWFRLVFPGIGLILMLGAVLPGFWRASGVSNKITRIILSLEIGIGFLQIGLFFLFFVLARFFRVRWRQYPYGIALGFGLIAAGTLSASVLRSEFGTEFDVIYQTMLPLSYTLAVAVWLITFALAQPGHPLQGKILALTPEEMLAEIKQYSRTAKRVLKR